MSETPHTDPLDQPLHFAEFCIILCFLKHKTVSTSFLFWPVYLCDVSLGPGSLNGRVNAYVLFLACGRFPPAGTVPFYCVDEQHWYSRLLESEGVVPAPTYGSHCYSKTQPGTKHLALTFGEPLVHLGKRGICEGKSKRSPRWSTVHSPSCSTVHSPSCQHKAGLWAAAFLLQNSWAYGPLNFINTHSNPFPRMPLTSVE